jgi:hypothetical protein
MSLTFTAKPTASALPPLGTYQGKLTKLELGEPRLDNFNKERHIAQIKFVIAMTDVVSIVSNKQREDGKTDEDVAYEMIDDGAEAWAYANAFAIKNDDVAAYNNGNKDVAMPIFGKKSNLRGWYEAISGRTLEDDDRVSLEELLDQEVLFTVEANENGNPTIKQISAYKKPSRRRNQQEPEDAEEPHGTIVLATRAAGDPMSPNQQKYLFSLAREAGVPNDELEEIVIERFGHGVTDLLKSEASALIGSLQELRDERALSDAAAEDFD